MRTNTKKREPDNFIFKPDWKPVLTLIGDWDGNGSYDNLTERYFREVNGKDLPENFHVISSDNLNTEDLWVQDSDTLIGYVVSLKPRLSLVSSTIKIPTLNLPDNDQSGGLLYLMNLGNLDGKKEMNWQR